LLVIAAEQMADKRRYTVSLPDHVADAVEKHGRPIGSTPTEYAADVIRWWFGQGCPPVTHDEAELRKTKAAGGVKNRIEPIPDNLNAWTLDPEKIYAITEDAVVQNLLDQLGLPNLFAQAAEHDSIRFSIAFDNHPTHWLVAEFFKGSNRPDGDGLSLQAYPKLSVTRSQMIERLTAAAKGAKSKDTVTFSQIPNVPGKITLKTRSIPAH
jgi:hypothetical protein